MANLGSGEECLFTRPRAEQVATLFDLRINRSCPISAPLPLTTLPADGFSPVYSPHWLIAPPDKVVDPLAGRAGRLRLNLRAIAASSIDKVCLLEFLLLRSRRLPRPPRGAGRRWSD